jgi:hypothetical protein
MGPEGPPLEHLTRALDLDAGQRMKVQAIFERHRERLHTILEEAHNEIREVLRPDQRERFDSMMPPHPGPWGPGGPPGDQGPSEGPARPRFHLAP